MKHQRTPSPLSIMTRGPFSAEPYLDEGKGKANKDAKIIRGSNEGKQTFAARYR